MSRSVYVTDPDRLGEVEKLVADWQATTQLKVLADTELAGEFDGFDIAIDLDGWTEDAEVAAAYELATFLADRGIRSKVDLDLYRELRGSAG